MSKNFFLVTGCCGFIGFHLVKRLLLNKKNFVIGIDNFTNYYSKDLKLDRLKIIKKKNFKFFKIDLSKKIKLRKIFIKYKFTAVFHAAAQAGVLYSYKNPDSYFKNNLIATKNIVDLIKEIRNVDKFIFCSSSSVYGDQKRFPVKEDFKLKPKNYYAITKKKSEEYIKKKLIINIHLKNYIIFRLFTVYGPYGRPDMFLIKNLFNIYQKNIIKLYNYGRHYRDFTYIEDVINIFCIFLKRDIHVKNNTINLCGSKPIKIILLINLFKKFFKKNFSYSLQERRVGEVFKTYGSNKRLVQYFKYKKFVSIVKGVKKTIHWFNKYKKKKNLIIKIQGI
jgi:UDP-glucuronate 4-epimerase